MTPAEAIERSKQRILERGDWNDIVDGIRESALDNGMDRLRGIGNAVVPQVAEWLGRRILESGSPH